jgi:DnaJ-class molecular chaperone
MRTDNIFDLMEDMTAELQRREAAQRVAAMPDWEKQFMLGYLQYTEAHPEVIDQCSGFGCVDGCADCRGCPDCDGEGRTPNGSCTGDTAGGWADTCETCHGSGKDMRGCDGCGVAHTMQACPAIHERLMR